MRQAITVFSLVVVLGMAFPAARIASADLLWDQSDFDLFGAGFFVGYRVRIGIGIGRCKAGVLIHRGIP